MLVEYKKPGRPDYDERHSPMNQVSRYLNELASATVVGARHTRDLRSAALFRPTTGVARAPFYPPEALHQ
jgi:hypothetical protein